VPLVEKDGIQVVFEGHLHAYARSRPHRAGEAAPGRIAAQTGRPDPAYWLTWPSPDVCQGRSSSWRVPSGSGKVSD